MGLTLNGEFQIGRFYKINETQLITLTKSRSFIKLIHMFAVLGEAFISLILLDESSKTIEITSDNLPATVYVYKRSRWVAFSRRFSLSLLWSRQWRTTTINAYTLHTRLYTTTINH